MAARKNRNDRVFRPTQLELSEAEPAGQTEALNEVPASAAPVEVSEVAAEAAAPSELLAPDEPVAAKDPVAPVEVELTQASAVATGEASTLDGRPVAPKAPAAPAAPAPMVRRPTSFGNPGALELSLFCRQFATLVEAGIPALNALRMLAGRAANGRLRQAIEATARGVEAGRRIHEAMAPHACVFTPLVIDIIRAGETAGKLEGALPRLAEIMEGKARIKTRIRDAAIYPMVSIAVAAGVLVSILVMAIPRFTAVYGGKENLPAPTQFVIDLSEFFMGAWGVLLVGAVGLTVGLRWWLGSTPGGRRAWAGLALHLPVLSGVSRKIAVVRSARMLGGLVNVGIPLTEALAITSESNENALFAEAFNAAREQVEKGERMAGPLAQANVIPPLVVDMIAVGEETGTLDKMLAKIADAYDDEVESTLSGLSSIIEPLLVVLLGGAVIFIALAVLLPYFRLAGRIES